MPEMSSLSSQGITSGLKDYEVVFQESFVSGSGVDREDLRAR